MKIIFEENELLGLKESCIHALNRLDEKENSELFRFIQIATDMILLNKNNEKKIIVDEKTVNCRVGNNLKSLIKELEEEYLNILNKFKQEEK
ncbi:MAG: hypothetical protein ACRC1T_09355 [Clostridium chrysemydis]|uniref:hypothetical protein n=1 Tax=Clostridium chrysemydis TaxID=2665504 RepID=UPI003F2B6B2B